MNLTVRYQWDEPPDAARGRVWPARDRLTGARVIVKVALERSPEARELQREAEILARFDHPAIPRLLDAGLAPGPVERSGRLAYISIPLLPGRPAAQAVIDLDPAGRRRMVASALTVLGDVHRLGILHGDLSPANLMVGEDGLARLIDFGLAQTAGEGAALPDLRGTPAYLAPERARGEGGDERSDLYSLGKVLTEALAACGEEPPAGLRRLVAERAAERPAGAAAALAELGLARAYPLSVALPVPPLAGREALIEEIYSAARARSAVGALVVLESQPGAGASRILETLDSRLGWSGMDRIRLHLDDDGAAGGLAAICGELAELGAPGPLPAGIPGLLRCLVEARTASDLLVRPLWLLLDPGRRPFDPALIGALAEICESAPVVAVSAIAGGGRLPDSAVRLPVGDLDSGAARELVTGLMGGLLPPSGLTDLVLVQTGGVPAAVVRTLRSLADQGVIRALDRGFGFGGRDPRTLAENIKKAVRWAGPEVGPAAVRLMVGADLAGPGLDVGQLAAVAGLPDEEAASAAVDLAAGGILIPDTGRPGGPASRLAIRDPAAAAALRERLPPGELAAIAGRAHDRAAARGATPLRLLELSLLAGCRERARHIWRPALEQATCESLPGRADLAIHGLVQLLGTQEADLGAEALLELAWLQVSHGQLERTIEIDERALEIARAPAVRQSLILNLAEARRRSGDSKGAAAELTRLDREGRLTPSNQLGRAIEEAWQLEGRGELQVALALLQEKLPLLDQASPVHRWVVQNNIGRYLILLERHEEARPYIERALADARVADLARAAADSSLNLGLLEQEAGRHEEAGRLLAEAARTYRRLGRRENLVYALGNHGHLLVKSGQHERGIDLLEEAFVVAGSLRNDGLMARLQSTLGHAYRSFGLPERAEESFLKALELGQDPQLGQFRAEVLQQIGSLRQAEGRHRDALRARLDALKELAAAEPTGPARELAGRLSEEIRTGPTAELAPDARHETLVRIRRMIGLGHDRERLLDEILRLAVDWTQAERCLILGVEPGGARRVRLRRLHGVSADDATDLEIFSESVAREVLATGRPVVTNDALADPRMSRYKSVRRQHLRSILGVPMRAGDRIAGVLYVDHGRRDSLFAQSQMIELLSEFAALGAVVLGQAEELERLEQQLAAAPAFGGLAGLVSPAMKQVVAEAVRVSATDCTVLLLGETGTGKGRLAQAIHNAGVRRDGPFLEINAAALPETLLEAELFGVVKGAHSAADRDRPGLFVAADGGTLFLDEIAEASPSLQAKLLRVLENGQVRPVGTVKERHVDVRLITATNRDPDKALAEGRLRSDLFHRLNVFPIRIPPLRERPEDIPDLARHFLAAFRAKHNRPSLVGFSPAAMTLLQMRPLPGNVRELENIIERAVVRAEGQPWLEADQLDPGGAEERIDLESGMSVLLEEAREKLQESLLRSYLEAAEGKVSRAAEMARIQRPNFHRLMKRYGIERSEH